MCIDHTTGFKLKPKSETEISNEGPESQNKTESLHLERPVVYHSSTSILKKCFLGPGNINEQRKFKRRCLGIHTYPILFDRYRSLKMQINSITSFL